jgi:UTP--glucose-1-phosphate uridylyltransferase
VSAAAVSALIAAVESRGLDGAIAVERVPADRVSHYGVVAVDGDGIVTGLVEKPAPGTAPSDLAVAARYVLPPAIFGALAATPPAADGEVQLTDAIAALVRDGARLAAVELPAGTRRLDIGSPAGYAAAFTAHALRDPELAAAVRGALDAHGDG